MQDRSFASMKGSENKWPRKQDKSLGVMKHMPSNSEKYSFSASSRYAESERAINSSKVQNSDQRLIKPEPELQQSLSRQRREKQQQEQLELVKARLDELSRAIQQACHDLQLESEAKSDASFSFGKVQLPNIESGPQDRDQNLHPVVLLNEEQKDD